jgi:isochorismate hydrolase
VVVVRVERPDVGEPPPGSELVDGVAEADDILIVKRTIGGFQGTGLHEQLHARGIATLVFAGIATNMGVESTARAASDHGHDVVFVEDAMAALTTEEHHAALTYDFPRFGDVVAAADITPGDGQSVFVQTETCFVLSLVNGSRFQPAQRSRSVIPASRAIRSSSDGHT